MENCNVFSLHVILSKHVAIFRLTLLKSTKTKHRLGLPYVFVCVCLIPFDFVYHPMQADGFAKKLGYASALRAGLVKLQVTLSVIAYFYFPGLI